MSAAFADVDQNGWLDVYLGNQTLGIMRIRHQPCEEAHNELFLNHGGSFEKILMPQEVIGQTMSTLFSDINGDLNYFCT